LTRRPLLSALTLAAAGAAHAQFTPDSRVTFSLSWRESDENGLPAGNNNGILDRGEHALLRLAVSFTNQNTVASFSPPIATFSSGTIRGFGWGWIDLVGAGQAQGIWNLDWRRGLGLAGPWDTGYEGTPEAGGAVLRDIRPFQVPGGPNSVITANPVLDIWRGVWTPESYLPRTVSFQCAAASVYASGVALRASAVSLVYVSCSSLFDLTQIPIIPAPASLLCLAPMALASHRRRSTSKEAGP
jgi:hypothetical protein